MRYKANVDRWFKIILISPLIILLLIPYIIEGTIDVISWITFFIVAILVLWLLLGSHYTLKEDHLLIVMVFIRQRIKYEDIQSVKLTKNLYSSMALSLERIEIKKHNAGFYRRATYISPENREQFYEQLIARCPHLDQS